MIVPPSESLGIVNGSLRCNNETFAARNAYARYQKIASHLVNEPSVLQLNDLIEELRTGEVQPGMAFVFLKGSSGIGKTQMAMTLLSIFDSKQIFYMIATTKLDHTQDIYRYYDHITNLFIQCARRDYTALRIQEDPDLFSCDRLIYQKLYLYGFVCALVEGEYGRTYVAEIHSKSAGEVLEAMEKAGMKENRPVAILDEYNYYTSGIEDNISSQKAANNAAWLRLCRNVFRSVGFVVVATGTEARAANIIPLGEISRREVEKVRCYIYSDFPPVHESCLELKKPRTSSNHL